MTNTNLPNPLPRSFKARAECILDFVHLLNTFPDICQTYTITSTQFPDIDIEFTSFYTLNDIKTKLSYIEDAHVIQETVNLSNYYTGERDLFVPIPFEDTLI